MTPIKGWRLIAALGVFVLCCVMGYWVAWNHYAPQTLYVLYRAGLGEKSVLEDIDIRMSGGWFPMKPKDTGKYPTLIFHHCQWNRLGSDQSLAISKHELPPEATIEKSNNLISHSKTFPWGKIFFVRVDALKNEQPDFDSDSNPYKIVALVPSLGITIKAEKDETLNEIVELRKR